MFNVQYSMFNVFFFFFPMKERNHAFDLLCGLCILRMIVLHCVSMCGFRGCTFWFDKLMAWTFFFICFFFFKAGYFNKSISAPTKFFLKDKFKRLFIPYLTWGAIGSIFYFGILLLFPHELHRYWDKLEWSHVWMQSHFYGNPPVWFLFSFFCMYVMVHFMQKVPYLAYLAIFFPLASWVLADNKIQVPMSLGNVFMGVYFFYLGKCWHWLLHKVPRHTFMFVSLVLLLVFLFGNHYWHGEYDMSLNHWVHRPWGAVVNITCALCGISGILLMLPAFRVPFVAYIGEHSMVYFVLHYPILLYYAMVHGVAGRGMNKHWDDCILVFILIISICTWMVPYIEKVPWLSGRWPKTVNKTVNEE